LLPRIISMSLYDRKMNIRKTKTRLLPHIIRTSPSDRNNSKYKICHR
jgi:hypothetical protein